MGVQGLGFRVWDLGIYGLGFKVRLQGLKRLV